MTGFITFALVAATALSNEKTNRHARRKGTKLFVWDRERERNHYSAGYLYRLFGWDFDSAREIPQSGPVRDRHNSDLLLFNTT